jgi:predicted AlkP superfamily phosphohydrolase/phosphomutase
MNKQSNQKTVMLGLDAGDLAFIQSHISSLPGLRRIFEIGKLSKLKTTSDLLTGSVWPTFYTGTLPGEHGIYHHLQWDPDAMQIRRVAEDWLYSEPFWYDLARRGIKVTVADVPMVFPSRLQTGIEVVNWGSHDQLGPFHCNRPDITNSIRRQFGAHPMGPEIPVAKSESQLNLIRQNLIAGAQRKGELIQTLLKTTDWDYFLAVFGETHRGGHILWPENIPTSAIPDNALLEVYQAVDQALCGILNQIDFKSTDLILFSLHGMQANMSQEHFVAPIMEQINTVFFQEEAQGETKPPKQRSIMRWLRNSVPAPLQHAVAKAVSVQMRDWVVGRATSGGYDWLRTPAFALLADYNGYLRFNISGREKHGCISRDTPLFHRYSEFVRESFLELQQQSTNLPLVQDVIAAQTVFPGIRSHILPDFVVTWTNLEPATKIHSRRLHDLTAKLETGRSGNHRHEGFVVIVEAEQTQTASDSIDVKHITDLAPLLQSKYKQ